MRLLSIDLLKIISIFFVVLSHVTLFFLSNNGNDVYLYFFRQSGQLGVVLFFMCSGYFLLNNTRENQVDYILGKIKGILSVLLFWLCFYYLYDSFFISRFTAVDEVSFLTYFNVSHHLSDATHLWFIFSIIGLYILTPFIRCAFREANAAGIKTMLIIMVFVSNLTLVNALTDYAFSFKSIPDNLLLPFQTEGLISFLVGGYLGLIRPKVESFSFTHIMLLILAVVSFSALSIISSCTGITFFYGKFYNILLQASSFCTFLFVMNVNINSYPSIIDDISKSVLGIYLIHNIFVVEVHSDFIHNMILREVGGVNTYFHIVSYSILAFILSYLFCSGLRKSKLTEKIITL